MLMNIEFVCTANKGKSPIALSISRDYFKSRSDYRLFSSGTRVNRIAKSNGIPLSDHLRSFCNHAYEKFIISQEELDLLDTNPRALLKKLLENERTNRNRYLGEKGLKFDEQPIQTKVLDGSRIIACIGKSNLQQVCQIYDGSGIIPRAVDIIGDERSDLGNQWVLTYDEFREIGETVRILAMGFLDRL